MAANSNMNPSDKHCFKVCTSCFRCEAKHEVNAKCRNCSGHHDPQLKIKPNVMDVCMCNQGIMRWVTQKGLVITKKLEGNPYQGTMTTVSDTEDERDWKAWLEDQREKLNDPTWEPIDINRGGM